jgi:hypothetical protein
MELFYLKKQKIGSRMLTKLTLGTIKTSEEIFMVLFNVYIETIKNTILKYLNKTN